MQCWVLYFIAKEEQVAREKEGYQASREAIYMQLWYKGLGG